MSESAALRSEGSLTLFFGKIVTSPLIISQTPSPVGKTQPDKPPERTGSETHIEFHPLLVLIINPNPKHPPSSLNPLTMRSSCINFAKKLTQDEERLNESVVSNGSGATTDDATTDDEPSDEVELVVVGNGRGDPGAVGRDREDPVSVVVVDVGEAVTVTAASVVVIVTTASSSPSSSSSARFA
jgi:hypothetical protein